jgi:hypothetical protein
MTSRTRVAATIFHPVVISAVRMRAGGVFIDIAPDAHLYFADIDAARAFLRDANEALARMNEQPPARHDNEAGDAAHVASDAHLGGIEVAQ